MVGHLRLRSRPAAIVSPDNKSFGPASGSGKISAVIHFWSPYLI